MTPEQRAKIFKALSDPRRVDMVDLLAKHGAMCGTQLAETLGISVALVSHHWEVLIDAGIVSKQREGQLRYCTLDAARIREATEGWDACHVQCAELQARKNVKTKPTDDGASRIEKPMRKRASAKKDARRPSVD